MASSISSPVSWQEPQQLQSRSSLKLQQSFPGWSLSLEALTYRYEGKQRLTALSYVSGSRTISSWKRQCRQARRRAAQSSGGGGGSDEVEQERRGLVVWRLLSLSTLTVVVLRGVEQYLQCRAGMNHQRKNNCRCSWACQNTWRSWSRPIRCLPGHHGSWHRRPSCPARVPRWCSVCGPHWPTWRPSSSRTGCPSLVFLFFFFQKKGGHKHYWCCRRTRGLVWHPVPGEFLCSSVWGSF